MNAAQRGLDQVRIIGDNCKSHLISDLLVGAELLGGCLRGSYFIARQNVRNISDETMKEGLSLLLLKKLDEGVSTLRDLRHRFIEI